MNPLALFTHEYSPKPLEPRDRKMNPLDPRERYRRQFTQPPVHIPLAPTGSFNYRNGFYDGRWMTRKEQQFEQLVNAVQARHDELSDLIEWRRCKDVEEEAISIYFELGQDLKLFIEYMRTFDQQEAEFQCQRKGEKLRYLYPEMFPKQLRPTELRRQERLRTQEADERKREQQRIKSVAQAKFKADVQASIDPIVNTNCNTNAAGSQKASEENKLKQSKPKNPRSDNQAAYSNRAGSSRQQEHKATLSVEEKRRQFLDQVRSHAEASRNNSQSASATEASSSKQQEPKATFGNKGKRPQVQDQVRARLGRSHDSDKIASSAATAPSEQQEHEARLSVEGYGHLQSQGQSSPMTVHINNQVPPLGKAGLATESHSQDNVRVTPPRARTTTPPPIAEADPSVKPERAAAAQRAHKTEFAGPVPAASKDAFTAELAGYQPRMGMRHNVHYPKGAVLVNTGPGLAKVCLRSSSVEPQTPLPTDIGQGMQVYQATGSSTSSHRTSSQGSTPPSSLHSSPPKTPIVYPLNDAPAVQALNTQHEHPDNVALFQQLEASAYGSVRTAHRFARQKSSRINDPVVTSVLQGLLERVKARAAVEEFNRDLPPLHQQQQQQQRDDGGYGQQRVGYGQQQGQQFGAESGIWGRAPWN